MAADLTNITERLTTVATWHTGRQRKFIEDIITDLGGAAPSAPPAPAPVTALPGEGSGGAVATPPVPPG